jgi:drug/metabolite transporter (DMT)-like permease
MTKEREPRAARIDAPAALVLVFCCALWGLNQVAIKAALPEVGSLIQLSFRSVIALVLVLGWMRWRGIRWNWRDGTLWPGLLAGLLFAIEFGCIFIGLQYTTAARSVVFINTSPFVVALVLAWLVPAERLRPVQILGLAIAFGGVAFAFAEPAPRAEGWPWLGDALILVAAALWGLTTVIIRFSSLRNAAPEKTLAYQLLVSALLSPAAAWVSGAPWPTAWSALAIGSLFYQAVIVTFASYLLWFGMLTRYPATKVQAFVFLTPVFGAAFAAGLLGEPLGVELLVALVAVAVGLSLLNRRHR